MTCIILINDLNVNILNGDIYAGNVVLYEVDGATPFVSFEQLRIDASTKPIFSKDLQVHAVQLDRLHIRVKQDSTHFNFDDILSQFSTIDSTKEQVDTNSSSSAWAFHVRNIAILGGKVDYYNANLDHLIGADSINILCPAFQSDDPIADLDISIDITESGSGNLKVLGT